MATLYFNKKKLQPISSLSSLEASWSKTFHSGHKARRETKSALHYRGKLENASRFVTKNLGCVTLLAGELHLDCFSCRVFGFKLCTRKVYLTGCEKSCLEGCFSSAKPESLRPQNCGQHFGEGGRGQAVSGQL